MRYIERLSRKWKIVITVTLVASVCLAVLSLAAAHVRGIPDSQRAAARWSGTEDYAQISVFYTEETSPDKDRLEQFESSLERTFAKEDIVAPTENARLWVSAYSASGSVQLSRKKNFMQVNAVGVAGDFFLFHPFKLISGSFFSDDALMKDGIVIDEETAWQLFGSTDVIGMKVDIGGVSHYVSGVIARECDWMEKRAGADEATVYLSYDSLSRYGSTSGITCYEIILPNRISGYGMSLVKQNLGVDGKNVVAVENSERYSWGSLLGVIGDFGIRSMQTSRMVFPAWENAARGWEDVLAVILAGQLMCTAVLVIVALILCVTGYRAGDRAVKKWWKSRKMYS